MIFGFYIAQKFDIYMFSKFINFIILITYIDT